MDLKENWKRHQKKEKIEVDIKNLENETSFKLMIK